MRKHLPYILLSIGVSVILASCSIIRKDMFNPGGDGKGSGSKITVDVGDGLVTSESGISDIFTVVLNEAPTADATFPISSTNTAEAVVMPSSVTFTTANYNVAQTVTVTGVNDFIADGTQPVTIDMGAAVSADSNWNGFNPADVTAYNYDNDSSQVPGVTVSATGTLLLSEIGTSGSFAVVLGAPPSNPNIVTIPVSVSDGSEATITSPFSGAAGNLSFTNGNWSTPQVLIVTGVDDSEADGNYAGIVTIGSTSSGDLNYNGMNPPDVPFTTVDNDAAGVTVSAGAVMIVSESPTANSFTVVLSSSPSGASTVTVPLSVSDGTEAVITNPASLSLTFDSSDWDVPQAVTVQGVDDTEADGNTGFTVILGPAVSSDTHYSGLNPPDVNFTTIDDDAAGVTVSAGASMLVSESGTDSSFTVFLNSQPGSNVTIGISVGTPAEATITSPFFGSSGVLTFTSVNWSTPQAVTVAGVNDLVDDGNQLFTVGIGATGSSDPNYSGTFNPPDLIFTNVDDDTAGVTVSAGSSMAVSESGTSSSFTMVLNSRPLGNVSVMLSIDDISEGVFTAPIAGTSGALVFTPADWNVARTITVRGLNDGIADGNQNFNAVIGATSSPLDPTYNGTFNPPDVLFTCIDDVGVPPTPGVVVLAISPVVVSESGTSSSFQMVLTSPPADDVSIPVIVTDTTEGVFSAPFSGSSGTIFFTPGNWNTPQSVTVTGVKDNSNDGNQSFWVDFGFTASSDPGYNGLTVADVLYTCVDDYSTGVTVMAGSPMLLSESGTGSSFYVVLNSMPAFDVSIDVTVLDATEGRVAVPFNGTFGTLTFTPANWNLAQQVTVVGVDDAVADGNVGFTVDLFAVDSTDLLYDNQAVPDVNCITLDNETPGITVNAGSGMLVSESGTTSAFSIVLNSQPTAEVTIPVQVTNVNEATIITPFAGTSGVLTFNDTNWSTLQTITVMGVNDLIADGNVAFTVDLMEAVSSDPVYDPMNPIDVAFTNIDDDTPGITVNVGNGLITKEHPTAPLSDTFSVVLNTKPTANVTISPITSGDPTEVTVSPASITFNTGNWSIPQFVTVTGVDDGVLYDDYQVVTVSLGTAGSADTNYNGMNAGAVSVYNLDDEVAPGVVILNQPGGYITTENGAFADIQVVLNTMPTANVTVGPVAISDLSEGSAVNPVTLTFTPLNWDCPQTVRVTPVNDGIVDGDVPYSITFGTTSSPSGFWNGLSTGSVTVLNKDFVTMAGVNPYTRSMTGGTFTSIAGIGATDLTGTFQSVEPATYFEYDEGYSFAPIGFTFYYMGMPYRELTVYTDGFAAFNRFVNLLNVFSDTYLYTTGTIADEYINILAPWWDDLKIFPAAGCVGRVWYKTTGSAPFRVFTLEWNQAMYAVGSDDTFTFQIRLYESTDVIEFVYGPKSNVDGDNNDSSAACGIKDNIGGDLHFIEALAGYTDNSPTIAEWKINDYPSATTIVTFTP